MVNPGLNEVSVAHLTEWDAYIWGRLEVKNKNSPNILAAVYQLSDRRDTEMMLTLQRFRSMGFVWSLDLPNLWSLRDTSEPLWTPVGGDLRRR